MAEAAEDVIDFLLSSKGMMHRDTICQTVAEQEFDLEVSRKMQRMSAACAEAADQHALAHVGPHAHCARSAPLHALQRLHSLPLAPRGGMHH